MEWYWLIVQYYHNIETRSHRYEASDSVDAKIKAQQWCIEHIGFYNSLAVAKEVYKDI